MTILVKYRNRKKIGDDDERVDTNLAKDPTIMTSYNARKEYLIIIIIASTALLLLLHIIDIIINRRQSSKIAYSYKRKRQHVKQVGS